MTTIIGMSGMSGMTEMTGMTNMTGICGIANMTGMTNMTGKNSMTNVTGMTWMTRCSQSWIKLIQGKLLYRIYCTLFFHFTVISPSSVPLLGVEVNLSYFVQ